MDRALPEERAEKPLKRKGIKKRILQLFEKLHKFDIKCSFSQDTALEPVCFGVNMDKRSKSMFFPK